MTETELEGVLDRIRKLMRLAGNNSNANEAALAAAKANELMLRYKLDSVTVDGLAPVADAVRTHMENEPIFSGRNLVSWKNRLASTLAYHNACRIIHWRVRGATEVRIIGTKANAEVVGYLYSYIAREIERICKDEMSRGVGFGKTWANSFKVGAVIGVGERLREMKATVAAEYTSVALVVLDREREALAKRYEEIAGNFKKSTAGTGQIGSVGGLEAGRAAGRGISVNRGIGGGQVKRELQ